MGFDSYKIIDKDITDNGVQSQPNKLAGSAAENKAVFDKLISDVVKTKLNGLIDELLGSTAASQLGIAAIPGYDAGTVQAALEEIVESMQDITQGSVADGSITTAKIALLAVTTALLADGSVTADKLGTDILPANVGIVIGPNVPTTADISEGQIYLRYS